MRVQAGLRALIAALLLGVGAAQEVRVAAASDLAFAMEDLVTRFQAEQPGVPVRVQLGSSGQFFAQIQQGLPVDIFFSADVQYPEQLESLGLTEPGTLKLYALGRIVLWVGNRLVADGLEPEIGPDLLRDPRVRQVALANPVHAPYGRAAVTLLEHYGFITRTRDLPWEELTGGVSAAYDVSALERDKPEFRFIYGENVSQAAQLAASSAGVGIFAYSLALAAALERQGEFWLAPPESHLRLEQALVILKGRDRPEVRAFHAFVTSEAGREVLARYGFELP